MGKKSRLKKQKKEQKQDEIPFACIYLKENGASEQIILVPPDDGETEAEVFKRAKRMKDELKRSKGEENLEYAHVFAGGVDEQTWKDINDGKVDLRSPFA